MITKDIKLFFSSRRRHTRCALVTGVQTCALPICAVRPQAASQFVPAPFRTTAPFATRVHNGSAPGRSGRTTIHPSLTRRSPNCGVSAWPDFAAHRSALVRPPALDRKAVVSGKGLSGRVDLGGRRFLKKKTYI